VAPPLVAFELLGGFAADDLTRPPTEGHRLRAPGEREQFPLDPLLPVSRHAREHLTEDLGVCLTEITGGERLARRCVIPRAAARGLRLFEL